jgi:hypothetical protein
MEVHPMPKSVQALAQVIVMVEKFSKLPKYRTAMAPKMAH